VTGLPALRVLSPGPLTTVQDDGRLGLASIGVSPSGAADRRSYRLANRLVGNVSGAPALEVTAGGLVLRAERDVLVAVTGAPCPGGPQNASAWLRAGDELRLGTPERGLRSYVAVRGGLDVTLSAWPVPTTDFLMALAEYSCTARPESAGTSSDTARAWPSFKVELGFLLRKV